jgi:lipopolysaccharide/colanic/teichoic acid biosynthesis glycosyltransferase
MTKRLFDVLFSAVFLLFASPVLFITAIGIKITSPGPVFYVARRAGLQGRPFPLYKFRTMHVGADSGSAITGVDDPRVFKFGDFLRKTKIDEFPQFWNVMLGHMSVVGPRPEAISIVESYYGQLGMSTLSVRPGIASPGSLFNYTHVDSFIGDDPESDYVHKFLPVKLALEKVYIDRASLIYDLEIILRTVSTILRIALGRKAFPFPKEYQVARQQNLF